ncbi:hypothetical protein SYNPS1DRAFT_28982 [Syncephalis pseudoplumigaleata]|uniref:Uncharacterized protein n=1 Tax=Syncephalis pseudoplumigaleata TaxID=1712513 RepID=A0A4P9Z0Q5_9FUNG|nr:hypothetical protein SYNPS1DRAFT_28982 [Syncephalis pseudoplumigaleata]|eukprot:RKP25281.1 hypothetical protein SYNPS1DRAFT_28982 [Syncephalis pseudoplumigaleata]
MAFSLFPSRYLLLLTFLYSAPTCCLLVMETTTRSKHEQGVPDKERHPQTSSPSLSRHTLRTVTFWQPLLLLVLLLLLASFLVKPVVVAAEVPAHGEQHPPSAHHRPATEPPAAQALAVYLATTVLGWLGQALYYVLRPFYLAAYWILYITILFPGQVFYGVYTTVAPVIGFLLVAAAVGVCVGGGAAWSVQTAAEMGWGDVAGHVSSKASKNDQLQVADDAVSTYSMSQSVMDDADLAGPNAIQHERVSTLRHRNTVASDFSSFSDWDDEEEEEEEEEEPLSNEEDPARIFEAILERDKKRKEEMKLGKVPADYVLWQQRTEASTPAQAK